MGLYRKEGRK